MIAYMPLWNARVVYVLHGRVCCTVFPTESVRQPNPPGIGQEQRGRESGNEVHQGHVQGRGTLNHHDRQELGAKKGTSRMSHVKSGFGDQRAKGAGNATKYPLCTRRGSRVRGLVTPGEIKGPLSTIVE